MDALLHLTDLDFVGQLFKQQLHALVHVQAFQHRLLVLQPGEHVGSHHVAKHRRAALALHGLQQLGHGLSPASGGLGRQAADRAHHCPLLGVGVGQRRKVDPDDLRPLHILRLEHVDEHSPPVSLQQHPRGIVGHVQQLLDHGDGTDGIQLLQAGMVHGAVPLCHHEQALVVALGGFAHCGQRPIPRDVNRDDRIRKHRQAPQRQQRQPVFMVLARHLAQ